MRDAFRPVSKERLADRLTRRIQRLIQSGGYQEGDRLPSIMEMARRFQVGHPSVREALKALETLGVVDVRQGSGVYVTRSHDVLLLAAPDFAGEVTKKLLVDLVEARMAIEPHSVMLAARNGSEENFAEMRRLLDQASACLEDDDALNALNMAFHREIARASGNSVLAQLIDVLRRLFSEEQRLILDIFGSRERDHRQHVEILEALERREGERCVALMRSHLEGVRDAILARTCDEPDREP